MVITQNGEVADHTLTQYTPPAEIIRRHGKTFVYDSGTGELIAELAEAAAEAVRGHRPTRMTYDGTRITTLED